MIDLQQLYIFVQSFGNETRKQVIHIKVDYNQFSQTTHFWAVCTSFQKLVFNFVMQEQLSMVPTYLCLPIPACISMYGDLSSYLPISSYPSVCLGMWKLIRGQAGILGRYAVWKIDTYQCRQLRQVIDIYVGRYIGRYRMYAAE